MLLNYFAPISEKTSANFLKTPNPIYIIDLRSKSIHVSIIILFHEPISLVRLEYPVPSVVEPFERSPFRFHKAGVCITHPSCTTG